MHLQRDLPARVDRALAGELASRGEVLGEDLPRSDMEGADEGAGGVLVDDPDHLADTDRQRPCTRLLAEWSAEAT